jgi:hypothetical protein
MSGSERRVGRCGLDLSGSGHMVGCCEHSDVPLSFLIDGRIIYEWIWEKEGRKVWIGFIWLVTCGGLLWTQWWTSQFLDRWEDNIWVDLREVGWEGVDWIYLAQDMWWAVVNTVMDLSVSLNAENFLCSWGTVSFWRKTLLLHAVSYWFQKLKIFCFCPKLTTVGFNVLDSSKTGQQITWFKGVCGDVKHRDDSRC